MATSNWRGYARPNWIRSGPGVDNIFRQYGEWKRRRRQHRLVAVAIAAVLCAVAVGYFAMNAGLLGAI